MPADTGCSACRDRQDNGADNANACRAGHHSPSKDLSSSVSSGLLHLQAGITCRLVDIRKLKLVFIL